MSVRRGALGLTGLATLAVLVFGSALPASASSDADEAVATIGAASVAISEVSGTVPLDGAVGGVESNGEVAVAVADGEVVVDTQAGVVTLAQPEAAVGVSIADSASEPALSSDGFAVFDVGDDASTVVLPQQDGAAQFINVIDSASAPTTFTYDLELPEGATAAVEPVTGGVIVSNAAGEFLAAIAPAWALDAAGVELPTHFEVVGASVTQVIDHAVPGTTYPVTADPYLGTNLFSYVRVNTTQTVVALRLSAWGMAVWARGGKAPAPLPIAVGIFRGQVLINQYGWPEMLNRMTVENRRLFNTTSVGQQFSCHALGWIADYRGWEWNLERLRPAMNRHWVNNVWNHHCNWNYADGRV